MNIKKMAERRALDAVYGRFDIDTIETDPPDFICTPAFGDAFGVEITDFYLTESDARRGGPDAALSVWATQEQEGLSE